MGTDAKSTEANTPPRFLYRYLDRYGLDAIYHLELKITPPNEFNDPFEFVPRLSNSDREQKAICRRVCRVAGDFVDARPESKFAQAKSQLIDGAPKMASEFWSKQFVVLCLSEKADTPSQWAHYANNHAGLALELDTAAPPFHIFRLSNPNGERLFFRVRYCSSEKKVAQELFAAMEEIENGNSDSSMRTILLQAAAEKSAEWTLEQESRLVHPIWDAKGELHSTIARRLINGKVMHFFQITPEAISRVILGAKASQEFEREVRKAALHSGIPDDRVVRAQLDYRNLAVGIP